MLKINRVGEKYTMNKGWTVVIVEYINWDNITVKFEEDGYISNNITFNNIKAGMIKNPYQPIIYGVGYIGEGDYPTSIFRKNKKEYLVWNGVLKRCYDERKRLNYPTYKDVTVCDEWHNFQNFAKWFEQNYNPETMQGWDLDKDILIKGNKSYSPETCCFVPKEINKLFTNRRNKRGEFPIGVQPSGVRFTSSISINGIVIHIGTFDTPEEAFQAYKIAKEDYIKEVADIWKPLIKPNVYQAMYNYKVEITD